jgi:peptide/nickel transport system permease protein
MQVVPLVLGVIVMNFLLIQLAPGSFLDVMTAEQQISDPALIEKLRVLYGMDQPLIVQLGKYIWSVFTLDFGFSS